MYSVIVFLFTLLEVGTIVVSYAMHSQMVFTNVVIYGSPLYMIMNLLGRDSAFLEKNPVYVLFALFHLIKYFSFFRAQMIEDSNVLLKLAIFMEAIYLAVGAYYSI